MIQSFPCSSSAFFALLQWGAFDYSLLLGLIALLIASGFFSGSETALFGMNQSVRGELSRRNGRTDRAVLGLLADPHMLLITVMLGNMTVNALYFVLSSVLMLNSGWGVLGQVGLGVGFLVIIVLIGEVLPKMVATGDRVRFARLTGPLLLALHQAITPLRVVLSRIVVTPLGRLASPGSSTSEPEDELHTLLGQSEAHGVIDEEEERILREVFSLSRLRVRDVMTPRVRVLAVSEDAGEAEVRAVLGKKRLTKLPVYRNDLDTILGILHVKRFLLDADQNKNPMVTDLPGAITPARFVPQMATLEQLLHQFQSTHTQSAIVVDEYGGTAGFVSIEDVVEELVGDITRGGGGVAQPQIVGLNQWRVDGEVSVHDWAEQFALAGEDSSISSVSTLGGLILHRLGKGAEVGDEVTVDRVRLQVVKMEGTRISTVLMTMLPDQEPGNRGGNKS